MLHVNFKLNCKLDCPAETFNIAEDSGMSVNKHKKASKLKLYTVRLLLSAVLGRTKFWPQKPQITEVRG